jgi:DNA-binding transcriptional ArsR family regulator
MRRDIFQAIADPTRRAMLLLLAVQSLTPNALALHFQTSRQAISKHLHILQECALVEPEQKGREILYHLNPSRVQELDQWVGTLRNLLGQRFSQLDDLLSQLQSPTTSSDTSKPFA